MMDFKHLRVMWLLNHTEARKFEVSMLRVLGVEQIFTPKKYPDDLSFRSASVDFSLDSSLQIPPHDLALLNAADWYGSVSEATWQLVNRYFDVVFALPQHQALLDELARYFSGAVVWRAYGLINGLTYDALLNGCVSKNGEGGISVRKMGRRFYFGEAYPHLADQEPAYLRDRRLYLPLGLTDATPRSGWTGESKHIYFVCPEILSNPAFRKVYTEFREAFDGLPYVVAGGQPIDVDDPKVLGYVSDEEHVRNMQQGRVMFYHSQEAHHIHYHPFEAVRAGMPLVFLAGGMLDRLGGANLPGRCRSLAEARRKIERILDGDQTLIEAIRGSQLALLDQMQPDARVGAWRDAFARIAGELTDFRDEQTLAQLPQRRARVAVILPVRYRGGSLRGALALAQALHLGSRQWGEPAEVVFVHLDDPYAYGDEALKELPQGVRRRNFGWKTLTADEARRAMHYAGHQDWKPTASDYVVPDDGMRQLMDCDLWVVVSDRLPTPLLPIRPVVLMVYDYLQRYEGLLQECANLMYLEAARGAKLVLVTTEFTGQDAMQYAGLPATQVRKVPILAPQFHAGAQADSSERTVKRSYFVWSTNSNVHKNHCNAAEALRCYYDELDGRLDCHVTGVDTRSLLTNRQPHLQSMAGIFASSQLLRKRVKWLGELPDGQYRRVLASSAFLWHPGRIDNGNLGVVEAASLGVPSLSSDYPAMREFDQQFGLNLAWMSSASPQAMAKALKSMETNFEHRRGLLPTAAQLRSQNIEHHAAAYWKEVRACL